MIQALRIDRASKIKHRVFSWSILIASMAGLIGLFALTQQGMFMEPVAPVLGVPYSYQTVGTTNCSFGGGLDACAPVAMNNLAVALFDFGIFFGIAFFLTSAVLHAQSSSSQTKRYVFPVTLFIAISLLVSVIGVGSTSAGASWTQPHWSTPSGVEVMFQVVELASGTATTPSSQGSAFLVTYLANYHWTEKVVTLYVYPPSWVNGPPPTHQTLYQCQRANSCKVISSIILQPYSITSLNTSTTAIYLGSPIQRGASYGFAIWGYNVGDWTNVTAS